jgi:hypothetical protein
VIILISGFRHDSDEICALLGYYSASCGNYLPTFWDVLVNNYHMMPRNIPEDHRSHSDNFAE